MFTTEPIKIVTVVGARPNFMKAAPIIKAISEHNAGRTEPQIQNVLVHTGQHYDEAMSDQFFADLGMPKPDVHLGIGSGSHATQTGQILQKFEQVILREKPHAVIVVGDVNSTLACALVTAKISFDAEGSRPLVAHVEAGLRSFDRTMPEEINRIVTDHLSDLLFVSEESGCRNLRHEGIQSERVHFVGNTMIDSLLSFQEKANGSHILDDLGLRANDNGNGKRDSTRRYALLTLHRPANVDNPEAFREILESLEQLTQDCPVIFPVHPRTQQRIASFGFGLDIVNMNATTAAHQGNGDRFTKGILLTKPLGYVDFLCLMKHAAIVVTDSGGIQEETTCLGIPCVTVRENTERPVTVEMGTNVLAGTTRKGIEEAIRKQSARTTEAVMPPNWDGQAARRIVDVLVRAHREKAAQNSLVSEPFA